MNKLSLNFFGEKVEVNLPETLASLRKNISEKFCFSPSDTAELVITYAKDLGKKIIETENDFKEFLKSKVFKVDLDVDQNSKIFQKSLVKLQNEKEADKKELDNLLSKSQELKAEKKQKVSEAKKKIDELALKRKEVEKNNEKMTLNVERDINNENIEVKNKEINIDSSNSKITNNIYNKTKSDTREIENLEKFKNIKDTSDIGEDKNNKVNH